MRRIRMINNVIHDDHIREGADKDTIMRRMRMINMKQRYS